MNRNKKVCLWCRLEIRPGHELEHVHSITETKQDMSSKVFIESTPMDSADNQFYKLYVG